MFPTLLSLPLSFLHTHAHNPSWHTLSSIPLFPRQEHSTLFLPPSTIAILGGVIPTNSTSLIPLRHNAPYAILQPIKQPRAPLPLPMNHANAAVVNGTIHLLGGLVEHEDKQGRSWQASKACFAYCPVINTWRSLPSLPAAEARGSAAMGVHDGKIYLAGGIFDLQFYSAQTQNSVAVVSVFDTGTETWVNVPAQAK